MKNTNIKRKATLLNKRDSNQTIKNKSEEKAFHEILPILQKFERSSSDNQVILNFLSSMDELIDLLKQSSDNYMSLLINISSVVKYERIEANRLIFKTGDEGEKFYLIFQGKVCVLVPQGERIEMSEEEYISYLAKLRRFGEHEILDKCMKLNNDAYPIDENDFDKHLAKFYLNRRNAVFHESEKNFLNIYEEAKQKSKLIFEEISHEIKLTLSLIEREFILSEKSSTKKMRFSNVAKEENWFDNSLTYQNITSAEEYIKEIYPVVYTERIVDRKMVSVWAYHNVKSLTRGHKFGEMALHEAAGKRTATLVTEELCHFGILDKSSYDQCLKELYEKAKKGNINMLTSTPIFHEYIKVLFVKNIYNFFNHQKAIHSQVLIREGEECNSVFFLKEGEYEFKTRRSLLEINAIIKFFGGRIKNENEEFEIMQENPKFHKFMNEKMPVRLAIVKNFDIIGLEDSIYEGKYLFNVECITPRGEYFKIDSNSFRNILHEKRIKNNTIRFELKKKKHIIERLIAFKKMRIKFFKDFSENRVYKEINVENRNTRMNDSPEKMNPSPSKAYNIEKLTNSIVKALLEDRKNCMGEGNKEQDDQENNRKKSVKNSKSLMGINRMGTIVQTRHAAKTMTLKNVKIDSLHEGGLLAASLFTRNHANSNQMRTIKEYHENKKEENNKYIQTDFRLESRKNSTNFHLSPTTTKNKKSPYQLESASSYEAKTTANTRAHFFERLSTAKINHKIIKTDQFIDCLVMDNFDKTFNIEQYYPGLFTTINNRSETETSTTPSFLKSKKFEFLVTDKTIYRALSPKIPELSFKFNGIDTKKGPFKLVTTNKLKEQQRLKNIYSNVIKHNKKKILNTLY